MSSKEEKALQRKLKTQATKAKNAELIKKMGPIKVGDFVFLGKIIGDKWGMYGRGIMKITAIENGEAVIEGLRKNANSYTEIGKIKIKDLKRRKDKIWVGKEEKLRPLKNQDDIHNDITDMLLNNEFGQLQGKGKTGYLPQNMY